MPKTIKEDIGLPHITVKLEDLDKLPAMSPEDAGITREAARRLGLGKEAIAFDVIDTDKPMTTAEAEQSLVSEMIRNHETRDKDAEHQPYSPEPLSLDEIKIRVKRAQALRGNGIIRTCRRFLREVDPKKH